MKPCDAEKVEAALEPHVGTLENSPIISIAISLKRIADHLDAVVTDQREAAPQQFELRRGKHD